jgi:hypothetical protein
MYQSNSTLFSNKVMWIKWTIRFQAADANRHATNGNYPYAFQRQEKNG